MFKKLIAAALTALMISTALLPAYVRAAEKGTPEVLAGASRLYELHAVIAGRR